MIGKIQSLCNQPNGHGQQASSASLDPLVPPLLGQDWPARPGGIPDPEGWGQAPGQVGFYRTNSLKLSVVTSFRSFTFVSGHLPYIPSCHRSR